MTRIPKSRGITNTMMEEVELPLDAPPSMFVQTCWDWYKENYPSNHSMNGKMLENIIELALERAQIPNLYVQVRLKDVSLAVFDIMLFEGDTPLALPVKTTIRERWKQAELEAREMKRYYPGAECLLLTLSEQEVNARRNAPEQTTGIDRFVLANTPEFDELVEQLTKRTFTQPLSKDIVQKCQTTIHQEKANQ